MAVSWRLRVAFEFIPEDQWEADHPKTLLATEVKVGLPHPHDQL